MLLAMWCSDAGGGAVYDVLGFVHPFMTASHDGMAFSTLDQDSDLLLLNCAAALGGGWWLTRCSLWTVTAANPMWFSMGDAIYHPIKNGRMMLKPQ